MRASVPVALMLALVFGGASAQGPLPLSQDAASTHDYGDGDKTCREWTDGCRTCRRSDAGDPSCSNIGIACQPKAIICARRAEPAK